MRLWRADLTAVNFWPPTFLGDLDPGHVHSGEVTGRAEEKQVGKRLRGYSAASDTDSGLECTVERGTPGIPQRPKYPGGEHVGPQAPHRVADLARLSF